MMTMIEIGPYRVLNEIARGGMAVVYRALQPSVNRIVALKVLPPHLEHDSVAVRRFRQEAETSANLIHDNIVKVWDASVTTPPYYIALEYLDGKTLAHRLANGPLSLQETVAILAPICSALDHAHQRGVIHRDLKPANILFTAHGKPVLTDFGIARTLDATRMTQHGAKFGTPDYMSPEQAKGLRVDHRSDLYAIAAVCYEMLTGRPPFMNDEPLVTMRQIIDEPVPSLRAFNKSIPPLVENVLIRALSKNTNDRYQSAVGFIDDLCTAAQTAPATTIMTPAGRSVSSIFRLRVAAVAGLLAVALLTVFVLLAQSNLSSVGGGGGSTPIGSAGAKTPSQVSVPNLKGVYVEEAKIQLKKIDLNYVTQKHEYDHGISKGCVISSSPIAGTKVSPQQSVDLTVSLGPQPSQPPQVIVPSLKDLSLGEAKNKLRDSNLKYGRIAEEHNNGVVKGYVISNTRVGAKVAPGTTVDLTISLGPKTTLVTVPNLQGMSLGEAKNKLRDSNLKYGGLTEEFNNGVAKGYVVSSSPRFGARVASGKVLRLTVSLGPQPSQPPQVIVPSLKDLSLGEAKNKLRDSNLKYGRIAEEHNNGVVKGYVISNTRVGAKVAPGTTVDLTISLGPKTTLVTVPNLQGMSLGEAKNKLRDSNLKYGGLTEEFNNGVTKGYVISNTRVGTTVAPGTTVYLTISLGP